MAERDYTNDPYEEWLRNTGGNPDMGKPEPYQPSTPTPYQPDPFQIIPPPAPSGGGGGGRSPAEIEAEGRAYDEANGLVGGYMMNGVWVNGSPRSGGGGGGGGFGEGTFGFNPNEFRRDWTQFNAPQFNYGEYAPFTPRSGEYKSLSMADAEQEPGYAFGRDQAVKSYMNSAAGRGSLRSGQSTNDILRLANNFAESNYANVDARKFRDWQANYDQDVKNYTTNRDTYGVNFGTQAGVFDRNYKGAYDTFLGQRKGEETEFSAALQSYLAKINALTGLAGGG